MIGIQAHSDRTLLERVVEALVGAPRTAPWLCDEVLGVRQAPPAVAETAEYGKYLAAVGCVGCHGPSLHGGAPPAPPAPDITTASGVTSGWTHEDFRIALRAGLRPNGTKIDTSMPWNLTTELSDVEIGALWAYINSLSPTYLVAGAR